MVHVLLVDDEPNLLNLFKQQISQSTSALRFNFHHSANAQECINRLESFGHEPVLLVIAKVNLPDMDHLALLKVVQKKFPRVKIYICTEMSAPYARKGNDDQGSLRFIPKPLNFEALYGAISEDFLNNSL
ncbi:response regulator [Bdellovibrio sp. HCB209]|uniref:response regulator n=1 Tax=Bdellovibrio sp. HCB209 TaxID=3394354 RepID=UPI0039B47538